MGKRGRDSRRKFIEKMGLSGASLAVLQPILSRLIEEAHGSTDLTPRMILINTGHGIKEECVKCTNYLGPGNYTIPEHSVALDPFKGVTNFFNVLTHEMENELHGPGDSLFHMQTRRRGGITIDQYLANAFRSNGVIAPSIALEARRAFRPERVFGGRSLFQTGPRQHVNPYVNPFAVVREFFGGVTGTAAASALVNPRREQEAFLLDFLQEDIKKSKARLASPEKEKLDVYLASLEQMSQIFRQPAPKPSAQCGKPSFANGIQENGRFVEVPALRAAYASLVANLIKCRITNVITLSFNPGAFYMDLFPEVPLTAYKTGDRYPHGEQRPSPHDLYHGLKTDFFSPGFNDPATVREYADKFDHRYQRMGADIAAMVAQELAVTPEGNGTMLDNTLTVWMSHGGGAHHIGGDRTRITTVGNIARNPMKTGVYHSYIKGEHSVREFWNALGEQMGVDMSGFGAGSPERLQKLVELS